MTLNRQASSYLVFSITSGIYLSPPLSARARRDLLKFASGALPFDLQFGCIGALLTVTGM